MNQNEQVPAELHAIAGRLDALGAAERETGGHVAERVAVRSLHVLRGDAKPEPRANHVSRVLQALMGGGVLAAVALLFTFFVLSGTKPGPTTPAESRIADGGNTDDALAVDSLAANIESDLETLSALDSLWDSDGFDAGLAVVALDAAGLSSQADDTDLLTALGSDS